MSIIGGQMNDLDNVYVRFLQFGLLILRQALDELDTEWARAEVEFLHNVPSLIGETNIERHKYFFQQERELYVEWSARHSSEWQQSRMRTFYEPLWSELGSLLANHLAQ